MIVVKTKLVKQWIGAGGITLYPFILVKPTYSQRLLNHEKIHIKQQLEMLIIPFYIVYLLNWIFNLIRYRNSDVAYRNVVFEKEAYACDDNLEYLKTRKPFAFFRYFFK
jgi:hypothetical protein